MRAREHAAAALVMALAGGARTLPWRASLAAGERLGDLARSLGVRRRVAEDNLAQAFPERDAAWRGEVLREHYRELGRVVVEYARLAELAAAPAGEVVAEVSGLEHVHAARAAGRGCIVLTAHFGHFELAGAWLARTIPMDFVYKPLSNPAVEAWIVRARAAAGVGLIPVGAGMRRVFESLRAGRVVAFLADQDAGRHGVFVPFLGRPASTFPGPAQLALRTGAPVVFGLAHRLPDGRHAIEFEPLPAPHDATGPEAVTRFTAHHAARLEARVRERPAMWFWLHRRWKTRPPGDTGATGR